ncbi:antibiotic biosynthesis monooxygenase [Nocardia stercoris]|uniref:antibiotic biosynthesis monooxygenase n=1 Tax=Nocardia stercoris TaxID=2483361 RepID=UPI001F292DA2|nr:antibiotic biosynthesis monooxygenase [Nocardia stercoris]
MFARSTTVQAQLSAIDEGITAVRDTVLPAVQGMPGCIGMSLLVDMQSGRCIATSAWQTEQAMRDSEGPISSFRAMAMFRGRAQVHEWEIALLHRDHRTGPGAYSRVIWGQTATGRFDEAIEGFRVGGLPQLEQLDGFCSASMLVNRATGRGVVTETFDSAAALDRSREQAEAIRDESTRRTGVEILDVGEFELALAHLRVPELV